MDYVKTSPSVQFSRDEEDCGLPQIIVKMDSLLLFFPETRPVRKIEVNPVYIWQGYFRQGTFNRVAIVRSRYHPNFVETGNLVNPNPADRGLRTFSRLACVS